jgi:hypothetical protein
MRIPWTVRNKTQLLLRQQKSSELGPLFFLAFPVEGQMEEVVATGAGGETGSTEAANTLTSTRI